MENKVFELLATIYKELIEFKSDINNFIQETKNDLQDLKNDIFLIENESDNMTDAISDDSGQTCEKLKEHDK